MLFLLFKNVIRVYDGIVTPTQSCNLSSIYPLASNVFVFAKSVCSSLIGHVHGVYFNLQHFLDPSILLISNTFSFLFFAASPRHHVDYHEAKDSFIIFNWTRSTRCNFTIKVNLKNFLFIRNKWISYNLSYNTLNSSLEKIEIEWSIVKNTWCIW